MNTDRIMDRAAARVALALLIGVAGALLFSWLKLPLPWMLGAMTTTTIAALLGAPVTGPTRIRPFMFMVLGVMLGSTFAPDILDRIGHWLSSVSLLLVCVIMTGAIAYPYFRKVARFDPVTAFFCAMPGGMSQMVPIGGAMGGDEGKIGLIHGSRVLLVVFTIPIWFQITGELGSVDRSTLGVGLASVEASDLLVLAGAGALGWVLAWKLRVPSAATMGPLIVSAALHVTGVTQSQPPRELVNLAQLIIGASVGCRFAGVPTREVMRALAVGTGLTVIMLAIAAAFAMVVNQIGAAGLPAAILSFAPGGLPEMTLAALALGVDVAFVVTHHVARIILVVAIAPVLIRRMVRTERHRAPP
ncbi:MAG: AbrB family transcriptional regulator [Alphaproteobacteria bacterium]|nr:AbrB family transcriptional regulator [Alphaproteobacteria bacterium]